MNTPAPHAPASGDPPLPDDAVEVARVVGAWGVKGGIKVRALSADPQALFSSKRWHLLPPDRPAAPGAPALPTMLRIVQAREQGEHIVATCQELQDRTAAEALKGARILIPRSSFPTPDDGEFYWVDLIGLRVVNRAGVELGRVDTLIETGPHCVLSIVGADPRHPVLVPFVDAYVDEVDRKAGTIRVDWDPED